MSDKNSEIPTWDEVLRTADRNKERKINRMLIGSVVVTMLASVSIGWHISVQQKAEAASQTTRGR